MSAMAAPHPSLLLPSHGLTTIRQGLPCLQKSQQIIPPGLLSAKDGVGEAGGNARLHRMDIMYT